MATRAKSAANGLNCPEIPSKRSFWRRYGAPGQEAENGQQCQICCKWPKLSRNPIEKAILQGFWAPVQEAENGNQGQIWRKLPKLDRNPVEKTILEELWGTWPGG